MAHTGGLVATGEGAVRVASGDGTSQVSWDGRFSLGDIQRERDIQWLAGGTGAGAGELGLA